MSRQILRAIHQPTGVEWACEYDSGIISGAFFRMKGLLGRTSLEPKTAIWLNPCSSIHMFFMRFPIDVVFLDHDLRVVKVYHSIKPWRVTPMIFGAKSCIEMLAGEGVAIATGDVFQFLDR